MTQIWVPPAESEASRHILSKTTASARASLANEASNRRMNAESLLEVRAMLILLARRDVRKLSEQPKAVWFTDVDGTERSHTFDLLAVFANGCRVAYAVKPRRRIRNSRLDAKIELIRRQSLGYIADKAVILTEQELSRPRTYNAEQVLKARRMRNEEDCRNLLGIAARVNGFVRVYDLLKATPEPGLARNALWCLIDAGVLEHVATNPTHTRITDTSVVRVNGAVLASTLRGQP
jgi:hypothetical protein